MLACVVEITQRGIVCLGENVDRVLVCPFNYLKVNDLAYVPMLHDLLKPPNFLYDINFLPFLKVVLLHLSPFFLIALVLLIFHFLFDHPLLTLLLCPDQNHCVAVECLADDNSLCQDALVP